MYLNLKSYFDKYILNCKFILIICFLYYFFSITQYYVFHENWNAFQNIHSGILYNLFFKGEILNFFFYLIDKVFDVHMYPTNRHSFEQSRFLGFINNNLTDILLNRIEDAKFLRIFGLVNVILTFLLIYNLNKKFLTKNENLTFLILVSTLPYFTYKILNGAFWLINFLFFLNLYISSKIIESVNKIQKFSLKALLKHIPYFFFNLLFFFHFPAISFVILIPASINILFCDNKIKIKNLFFYSFVFIVLSLIFYQIIINYYHYLPVLAEFIEIGLAGSDLLSVPDHYKYNIINIDLNLLLVKIKSFFIYGFSLWFFKFQNYFISLFFLSIAIIYVPRVNFWKTKFLFLSILIGTYTMPLIIISHEASLLRDNVFMNLLLVILIVKSLFFLTMKLNQNLRAFCIGTILSLAIIINLDFVWNNLVIPNKNSILSIKKQIILQKHKINNGFEYYFERYLTEKRHHDVFHVVGANYHGNVPYIIKASCYNICSDAEFRSLSFSNIYSNQLDNKINQEESSKVVIILDKDYFDNVFNN